MVETPSKPCCMNSTVSGEHRRHGYTAIHAEGVQTLSRFSSDLVHIVTASRNWPSRSTHGWGISGYEGIIEAKSWRSAVAHQFGGHGANKRTTVAGLSHVGVPREKPRRGAVFKTASSTLKKVKNQHKSRSNKIRCRLLNMNELDTYQFCKVFYLFCRHSKRENGMMAASVFNPLTNSVVKSCSRCPNLARHREFWSRL